MKDPMTKQHLITAIGNNLHAELVAMCSRANTNSILCNQSSDALNKFTWGKLHDELAERAPRLLRLLEMCTHTRKPRINRQAVIGMCAMILLKFRFAKMSLVQKMVLLILYAGHAGKLVGITQEK